MVGWLVGLVWFGLVWFGWLVGHQKIGRISNKMFFLL